MIRNAIFLSLVVIFFSGNLNAQFLIPGEGIMDVKIGADWDEIEWELGFRGQKINADQCDEKIKSIATQAGIDFDFMVHYQHLMWLPVTELLFKNDRVCMVLLSSFPEYNQMISADIGTIDGLNFWDTPKEISRIYGNYQSFSSGDKEIVLVKDKGFGAEISENEVRAMFIFEPK